MSSISPTLNADPSRSHLRKLSVILFASFALRMLGLTRPFLGNFAIYQTAQAMVARFFVDSHFVTWLYPQVNVLSNGKPGLLLLYYPVSSLIAAGLHCATHLPFEIIGKLQSAFFFVLAAIYLYRLVHRLLGEQEAFLSALVFSLFPLTLIYGQSFQNEMFTVFCSAAFFFYLVRIFERGAWLDIGKASAALSFVLLTRPNNLYLAVPAVYAFFVVRQLSIQKRFLLAMAVVVLSLILPAAWYFHVWKVSQTETAIYSTLFAQLMVRSSFVSKLALSPMYYRDLLDMFCGIVLTPPGFGLLFLGLFFCHSRRKNFLFFLIWGVAFLAASLSMPRKLIEHNFYWLHFLLPAAPIMAVGMLGLLNLTRNKKAVFAAISLLLILFMLRYGFHPAFVTPQEEKSIPKFSEILKMKSDKLKDRILVQGTHTLLYYSDRYGWPFAVDRKSSEISDYYKAMNWEKLPPKQWRLRNEAFREPSTMLEYYRQYEGATLFAVSDVQSFLKSPLSAYMFERFKVIYRDDSAGIIFDLKSNLDASVLKGTSV